MVILLGSALRTYCLKIIFAVTYKNGFEMSCQENITSISSLTCSCWSLSSPKASIIRPGILNMKTDNLFRGSGYRNDRGNGRAHFVLKKVNHQAKETIQGKQDRQNLLVFKYCILTNGFALFLILHLSTVALLTTHSS